MAFKKEVAFYKMDMFMLFAHFLHVITECLKNDHTTQSVLVSLILFYFFEQDIIFILKVIGSFSD